MKPRGITLVETLIALVVLAFGLLAVARLQVSLSQGADIARARTEAARHAQATMEALRAMPWTSRAAGSDEPPASSNTVYARSWTVTPTVGADLVVVDVEWTDRTGGRNAATLQSLMSYSDPDDAGSLVVPVPGQDPWWRPEARRREIPLRATHLDGDNRGRSALAWPGGGFIVFDDSSGEVVARCATQPDGSTDLAAECIQLTAYLLEGYISGITAGSPAIVFDRVQYLLAAPECVVETALAPLTNQPIAGVRRYRCLMQPADHDDNPATARAWSGRTRVGGVAGTTVCRYTPAEHTTVNANHPETYTLVTGSLDHQNFVLSSGGDCPQGSVVHPSAP